MHVAVAQRRVKFAQLWIGALLLVLCGVLLLPKGWLEPSAAAADSKGPGTIKPLMPKPPEPMPDPGLLALALDHTSTQKHPEPIAPPATDANAATGKDEPPPLPPPPTVRYLGAIIGSGMGPNGSDLRRAIVKQDERQKIVGEGEMIDADPVNHNEGSIKLLSVEPGQIVIETNGKQETIKLARRGDAPPVSVQPTGQPVGLPGVAPAGNPIKAMTPEDEAAKIQREKAEHRKGRPAGESLGGDGARGGK